MKNYKGYPLFNDIKNRKLRAFNRLNIMLNINGTTGEQMAANYAEQFTEEGRADILLMGKLVQKFGRNQVQQLIH